MGSHTVNDCDTECRTPNASGHSASRFIPLLHRREEGFILLKTTLREHLNRYQQFHTDGLTRSGDSDTDCRTPNASGHPAFRFIPLLHCGKKGNYLLFNYIDNRTPTLLSSSYLLLPLNHFVALAQQIAS